MADLTTDAILIRVKKGEKIERADLRGLKFPKGVALDGANLRRCELDGASLEGAKLKGANLKNASLREAYLVGANLSDANLENAELEGANLENANLAGANLSRASLEGAKLTGAILTGARLTHAQLDGASLAGADLNGALLTHSDFVECDLSGVKASKCDFSSCNLQAVGLEEADLSGSRFDEARLCDTQARGANFSQTSLVRADLSNVNFASAQLREADARGAIMTGAKLQGADLTGAKLHGANTHGARTDGVNGDWIDVSPAGDGSKRLNGPQVAAFFTGGEPVTQAEGKQATRYFGKGDVLRNATLEFDEGASVQIESLFEDCSITLGRNTDLVIGKNGTLSGCQIVGQGNITINGKFFEQKSPGIVGARQIIVTSEGALVAGIEQSPESTRFAFEPGSKLRLKISNATNGGSATAGSNLRRSA